MEDSRNFIIAIALTMAILLGYTYFYAGPHKQAEQQATEQARIEQEKISGEKKSEQLPNFDSASTVPGQNPAGTLQGNVDREILLSNRDKITINSPHLKGSIALKGARLDDLTLSDYKETLDKGSKDVALLSPEGSTHAYFVKFGWNIKGSKRPDANSVWTADKDTLEAGGHVTLTWDNGEGLTFYRTFTLDENYMFSITQRVSNNSSNDVEVVQYGQIERHDQPEGRVFFVSDQGPMWSLDEGVEMFKYSSLKDQGPEEKKTQLSTDGGWVGISDKYWLVALIPDRTKNFNAEIYRRGDKNTEKYFANYYHGWTTLKAGTSYEEKSRLFAGAKKISLLDHYTDVENVKMLNYAIDWGIFYFLTKPFYYLLEMLYGFVGNFGIAILMLTAIVKLALFPIANKGYKSMNKMKLLQPKMAILKEKYGDDKAKLQQATMELYKKEKVNPVSGCLPMFLQIPVFFSLYKVLYITIDMRHAPFFGWVKDLSGPDTMYVTNLFGLINWEPTGFLALGILPIIMGITMWLQMQMQPASGDPMQRKIMMFMPIVFTFMLAQFSVGLVIYWTFSNTLGILQQWVLMRRAEKVVPEDEKA